MECVRGILDFPDAAGSTSRLEWSGPARIIAADRLAEVRPALRAADEARRCGAWAIGFVGYEAAPAFDTALPVRAPAGPTPLVWFAVCHEVRPAPAPRPGLPPPALAWELETSRAQYDDAIRTIRDAIAAGDVYQVNYTLRMRAHGATDPRPWYDALVARGHGRYSACIETPDWALLSISPELFLDVRGRLITMRPMKGTLRRGRWLQEDAAARAQLAASAKDRAENLMIVDLVRNDVGRVARFGSVAVPRLFDVETLPTVLQMTSTITATLRDDVELDDVFAATFPAGSITGAPKSTATRAIARLEASPRGPYCGAVGVLRPDGSSTFNVGIRTVVVDRAAATAHYGVGGGITWDSRAGTEYDEALAKAALLHDRTPEFRLLETMRLSNGTYARLEPHLRRLGESAEYFAFCAGCVDNVRAALFREAAAAPHGTWRIRLLADADGRIDIERTPLIEERPIVCDVALATTPVSRLEPLLHHKTTARALYDARRADQPDAFDVLLFNEDGLVTEFTIGNLVIECRGALLTPPRDDGLLAGTFRAELLAAGTIRERSISIDEVRRAPRIWLINSVREWVPCRLLPHE